MSKAKPTKKTTPKKAVKKVAVKKAAPKKAAPKKAAPKKAARKVAAKKAAPKKAAPPQTTSLPEATFSGSASPNKRCIKLPSGKWAFQRLISGSWRHSTADIFNSEFQCKLRLSS
jgi:hypothetical protein